MTTINVQVGASADDGYTDSSPAFNNSSSDITVGAYAGKCAWYRFTGVTIPPSSTIAVAYLSLYERYSNGNPLTRLYFEKANNPAAPTNWSDYNGRTPTTAYVAWNGDPGDNGWYNSPSLVVPLQELVNAYGLNNQAIMVLHKDNGSGAGVERNSAAWDYSDHTYGAKLHIEYTSGGATARTSAETGSGVDSRLSFLSSFARADVGGGSEGVAGRGLARNDSGGGTDALIALVAAFLAAETGHGIEQSTLMSLVAKVSAETGAGTDIAALVARLASGETGIGVDAGMIPGLKSLFGGDTGAGDDALKALIGTSGGGADMKLPGRLGQVRIPSKGVSL